MSTRKIKDAKDRNTNELIYFKGHAKATFMSDGTTVEDAINSITSGGEDDSITEADIAAMGFTKNTGTYSKPSDGIPKTDLASDIQTSLEKADTALQSYTEIYTGTYSKPSDGIPKTDLASDIKTSLEKADTALQRVSAELNNGILTIC